MPILIQAFPDELDKMAPATRRDSFCGKFSIMDVFYQYGVPFTALPPHTVHPASARFADNIDYFDRLCRVVGGLKRLTVGAIGARTTPFKTVRRRPRRSCSRPIPRGAACRAPRFPSSSSSAWS